MPKHARLLAVLILACLVALPLAAQPAAAPATRKAMFWKVTSPTSVTYLLGSIHLGSKDMYPLPKEIEDAFEGSSSLLVEVDVRQADMQKVQAMVMEKGMYAGDDNLWNHVSPETRKAVEEFCAKLGIPAEGFARLKPWVVALTAATLPLMKAGMDPNLGIDKYLLDKAGKKAVVEIESAQWQIDLLSGFSDDLQEKFLAAATAEADEMLATVKRMQDAWTTGDIEKMDALIRDTSHTPPEINRMMLTDRNPHMADVAEKFLKGKEQTFLVVGAAHMIGKDGVVSILQKRGYKVEQVALKK